MIKIGCALTKAEYVEFKKGHVEGIPDAAWLRMKLGFKPKPIKTVKKESK